MHQAFCVRVPALVPSPLIRTRSANDQEDDRQGLDSVLSPRALREIYLMPFMIAQKYSNPWAYMTSYGKVNGLHVSESKELLQGVIRNEWKSDSTIMSDWWGVYEVLAFFRSGTIVY